MATKNTKLQGDIFRRALISNSLLLLGNVVAMGDLMINDPTIFLWKD